MLNSNKKYPFYKQLDSIDCGPTCIRMIAKYYGKGYSLERIRSLCSMSRQGISLLTLSEAAEKLGFRTRGIKTNLDGLKKEIPLPVIVHWKQNHFIVLYKIKRNLFIIGDPCLGIISLTEKEFIDGLFKDEKQETTSLILTFEPTPEFYIVENQEEKSTISKYQFVLAYVLRYKRFWIQIIIGMILGIIFQMIIPFLTQGLVDVGIQHQNIDFVYLVLIAQTALFIGRLSVDFIQSWIFLHISTRINVSLISDFLVKLMKLPMSYFDSRRIGDILQRIGDHYRIQSFLTSSSLSIFFSLINALVFAIILLIYNSTIFIVFSIGSIFYVLYILLFMKKRRELDFRNFDQSAENQSKLIQLINGMQEIKLNNCERQKRWEWENVQVKLFKTSVKGLTLSQFQQAGSFFINEAKNIAISILSAEAVISGKITLGMMLSIQYIIGQLNSPVQQLIGFFHSAQDANISLERLAEIHLGKNEEDRAGIKLLDLPDKKEIRITDLSFKYGELNSEYVLRDINLIIPEGRVTAIVGVSGSGKTTLLKLLLGFYNNYRGSIKIGDTDVKDIDLHLWRKKCGSVMQDGYIFSDSILNNVIMDVDDFDRTRLTKTAEIANIDGFINELPLGYETKIGVDGMGLSQGQRQRILIARSVYKNPYFLVFDEATNALDSTNEKIIMEKLTSFSKGKTVLIVAHRLSTVKNADQIVVLDKGNIVEIGNHIELTNKKGHYYELVKNQLELGT